MATATPLPPELGRMGAKLGFSREEAAATLGIGLTTLWRLEKQGKLLPALYIGRKPIYHWRDLARWLDAQCGSPPIPLNPARPASRTAAKKEAPTLASKRTQTRNVRSQKHSTKQ